MANSPLNKFISEIKSRDLARASRYIVTILPPRVLAGVENSKIALANLFCETSSLPEMSIETQTSRIFGESRNMPYGRKFNDIGLTFYLDKNLEVKRLFDKWVSRIVNPNNRTIQWYDDIIGKIKIETVSTVEKDKDFSPYKVTMFEAYPTRVDDVDLGYNKVDTVATLRVTFTYKYWTTEDVDNEISSEIKQSNSKSQSTDKNVITQSDGSKQSRVP